MKISAYNNQGIAFGASGDERRDTREKITTGVAGTAGVTVTARNYAAKQGFRARQGESLLQSMMNVTRSIGESTNRNTKTISGLWTTFKYNTASFTADILKRLDALQNTKFVSAIVKNPLIRKGAGLVGGALAFFVLITGVNKAMDTGKIAVGDIKEKLEALSEAA